MEGRDFGRYRIERLIGSGGMGDVYEALDRERDRPVALKLLPELFSGSAEFQERFRRESRLAGRLRDPHIIPIHDYGEVEGRLFIDMRLVDDGVNCATLLRDEGAMTPSRAVRIVRQIAGALDSAHAEGLVHRDVKPSNVLVTRDDFVYVVDFGIAHIVGRTAHGLTDSRTTVGTLDYMAPERFVDRSSDRRADVYSLACLLHECLTARKPFDASLPALVYAHLNAEPPRPSEFNPDVGPEMDSVVRVGMAKSPDDRYQSAGALAVAAAAAVAGAPTTLGADPAAPGRPRVRAGVTLPATLDDGDRADEKPDEKAHEKADGAGTDEKADHKADGKIDDGTGEKAEGRTADGTGEKAADGIDERPPPAPPAAAGAPPARTGASPPPTDPPTIPIPRGAGSADGPPPKRSRRDYVPLAVASAAVMLIGLLLTAGALRSPAASQPEAPVASDHSDHSGHSGASGVSPEDSGAAARPPPAGAGVAASPVVTGSLVTPATPGFVAVSPDDRFAYVANRAPRAVTVIELATRRTVASIPMPSPPRFIAISDDGTRAYVSCYTDEDTLNLVQSVDLRTNTVTASTPVDVQPFALALAPDQRTLWVPSHEAGSLDIVDTATATVTRRVPVAENPHWVVFGGDRAYVVNHESNLVTVMDARTATEITRIPAGISPHSAAVSPDGTRLAVVNFDGNDVTMIDTATLQVVDTIPVGLGPQHVSWAPDGRHFYTADVDSHTVSVVDSVEGRRVTAVPVGRSPTSVVPEPANGASTLVTSLEENELTVLSTAAD